MSPTAVLPPPQAAFALPGECPLLRAGDTMSAKFHSSTAGIHDVNVKVITSRRWNKMSPKQRARWFAFKPSDEMVICFRIAV